MAQETIDFIHAFCEDDEYSRQLPGKEDYVSIEKGVHKQKGLVCVISMNCLLHLKKQGSSGRHSVCVCTTHQNTILLVDALNWEVKHKDLVNKVVCDPANCECMMHHCTVQKETHYTNFWKMSSVTLILIFNFTTINDKLQRELPW